MRIRTAISEGFLDPGAWVEVHEWADDASGGPVGGAPLAPPDRVSKIGPFPDVATAHAFCTGPLREVLVRHTDGAMHLDTRTLAEAIADLERDWLRVEAAR